MEYGLVKSKSVLLSNKDEFAEETTAIFDDSDTVKPSRQKFEDLDWVIDVFIQNKEVVNGYHTCGAVILTKK